MNKPVGLNGLEGNSLDPEDKMHRIFERFNDWVKKELERKEK